MKLFDRFSLNTTTQGAGSLTYLSPSEAQILRNARAIKDRFIPDVPVVVAQQTLATDRSILRSYQETNARLLARVTDLKEELTRVTLERDALLRVAELGKYD